MPEQSATLDLLERWRQAAEAAYRGDLDATMGIFAPDAVWEVQPLGITHRGAPAIRSFLEDWLGSYENYEDDQEEGLDLGNGVVFVVSRLDARPGGSRGRVQERWYRDVAAEYLSLKRDLAKRFERDREAYTAAKTSFVRVIVDRALADLGLEE